MFKKKEKKAFLKPQQTKQKEKLPRVMKVKHMKEDADRISP